MEPAIWQEWWVWVVAGIGLGMVEVIVPGFIFLGFGASAVVVGLLTAIGLLGTSLPVMILVFAVLAVIIWLVIRKVVGVRAGQVKVWDRDINDN